MKGLWRKLMPFASDTNGAASVFAASPALVAALDSNGSVSTLRRVIDVSAGKADYETVDLPELAYASGDQGAFVACIASMFGELRSRALSLHQQLPEFIVLLNAPVSSLLGIDIKSMAHELEERVGVSVLSVETTGNRFYDRGVEQAYLEVCACGKQEAERQPGAVNIIGATELDWPGQTVIGQVKEHLAADGRAVISDFGATDSLAQWCEIYAAEENLVVSTSGLKAVRLMERQAGIPYRVLSETDWFESWTDGLGPVAGKVLVIGEQVQANLIRRLLNRCGDVHVDVGTFFIMDKQLKQENDVKFSGEQHAREVIGEGDYDFVIADEALGHIVRSAFIPLMHPPVGFGARDGSELSKGWLADAVSTMQDSIANARQPIKKHTAQAWDFSI